MSVWGRATIAEGVSMQNSHSLQKMTIFVRILIVHMHRTLIKAIGCVTGVIEFLW